MHPEGFGSVWGCMGVCRLRLVNLVKMVILGHFGSDLILTYIDPHTPPNTPKCLGMHCTTFIDALWCVWGRMTTKNGREMIKTEEIHSIEIQKMLKDFSV